MDENKDMKHTHNHGGMCDCGYNGMGMGRFGGRMGTFMLLRILILLLIIGFVFSAGMKFGELKGEMQRGYGGMQAQGGYMRY